MTCWEEIKRSRFQESPNPKGQLGVVLTQYHWVEVFVEEVYGQGGRTLLSQQPCVCDQGEPYSNRVFRSAVVNINRLERGGERQAELCP